MRFALLLFLVVGQVLGAGQNIVENAGFDRLTEDGKRLKVWGLPKLEGVEFAWDDEVKHSGERSGRIHGTDPQKQTRFVQAWRQNVAPLPAGPLLFTIWAKAKNLGNGNLRVLHKIKGGEVVRNQSLASLNGSFDWKQISAVIKPEPEIASLQLVIGLRKSTGTVWFDDVALKGLKSIGEQFGRFSMTPRQPQLARATVPATFTVTLGECGLADGGQLQIRGDSWRTAREFHLFDCTASTENADAEFEIGKPPKKTTWPPSGRKIACNAKLVSGGPLKAGDTVTINGKLTYTPNTNVSIGILGRIQPSADAATFPLDGRYELRAKGRKAADIRCIATAQPVVGHTGRVTVCFVDKYGNKATDTRRAVQLECNTQAGLAETYQFTADDSGSHDFAGKFPADTVSRVRATSGDMQATSNPILPREQGEPAIYFGDIHCHCGISGDAVGDPDAGYEYAEQFWGLDFASFTDHSPRGEKWEQSMAAANRNNNAGDFATFLGFEWSDGRHGHRNAYYRGDSGPQQPKLGSNMQPWWNFFDERDINDVMTVPHHPNTQSSAKRADGTLVWGPADWSVINHEYQRIVEICQNRGSFELPRKAPDLRVVREDCGSSVQTALAKGHRLGFIGSTDTHSGRPGTGKARVAIISDELKRQALWDAMYNRRCYATSGEHILLFFTVNGEQMGSEIAFDGQDATQRIDWRVIGTGPLKRVDLLRNNELVKSWQAGDEMDMSATYEAQQGVDETEWWYLRVIQQDTQMAWSSPVWVEPAE